MSAGAVRPGEVRAFIALGANLGARRRQLEFGLAALAATAGVRLVARSAWFPSPAVGGPVGQPDYLNGAAELAVELTPRALLDRLLELEREAGRDRRSEVRFGPRVLDLDLLLFGCLGLAEPALAEPGLLVPHPRLEERTFVLAPLATIASDLRLPSGATVAQRLASLEAAGEPVLRALVDEGATVAHLEGSR